MGFNMFKLISFDANGTLLRTRYRVGEYYSRVAKDFNVNCDPLRLETEFRSSWSSLHKQHPNFGLSTIGWRNWWKNIVIDSFIRSHDSQSLNEKILESISEKLIDDFSTAKGWKLTEGSIEILQFLKNKNIKVGVISNFDPRLHSVLQSLRINKYFDFVITSYEAQSMKPNVEIFRLAEKIANVDRSCCFHIGDNVELDFHASKNAGWDSAVISNKKKILLAHPSLDSEKIFNNLKEFHEYLKVTI